MLDVRKIREDFPILGRTVHGKPLVYLDNAATTQKPRPVIAALTDFYEKHNANVHRGVHTLSDEATALMDAARQKTAQFVGAPKPETVVFTRNATEAINLVSHSWGRKFISAGDEIVLTEMEHHSNIVPWQMLAKEKGARLRFIPVTEDGRLDMAAAQSLFTPKTKLLAFTAASNALGTLNPVHELIALAKSRGAKTLVDAAQWVPHYPTDVARWDCDFLAFSAHKMLGPTGVGVLYAKEELLESMDPFLGGGDMIERVSWEGFTPNVPPYKFEAGTPNIAGAAAFGAALDYLRGVGFSALREHEAALTKRTLEIFAEFPSATVYGPRDPAARGGIVSFNIEGVHPHDVGTAFDLEGVAVRAGHHCCQPLMSRMKVGGTARASFYLYNTLDEVETLGRALAKTAAFFKKPAGVK
ncbi:MAG TPA: cysteine desulfurase [Elusimicrobiota bacterium]|nr:cysteine desulfurase [Elusimicrobiota bacterium]